MHDTDPKIEELVFTMMMARTGSERVVMGSQMFDTARTMALASMPPGLSAREQKAWLARRLYGDEPELVNRFIAQLPL